MSEFINNSDYRKQKLQELIRSLHDGKTIDEVKIEFQAHFQDVSTTEISQIEQALIKEGLPIEEVQRLCDVHASVFQGSIAEIHATKDVRSIPGHPVHVFIEENKAIEQLLTEEIEPYLPLFLKNGDKHAHLMLRVGFDRLMEIDIHYARKENLFFPYLEKHGITAPPKVMWGVDDDIRRDLKEVIALLNTIDVPKDVVGEKITAVIQKVRDMIFKEDQILLPLLMETLKFYEWINIDEATEEIGYCLIRPTESWKVVQEDQSQEASDVKTLGEVSFDAGTLRQEEVNALLNTLPLDLTFVDANNKVKYFTQGNERIFQRLKTILGRDVSMCHPPASVHIVEKIVESFRNGTKDHEDFWIRMKDQFIYIRYFAVRNQQGEFLGTLEVTQNIKPITELVGEKRLLTDA